ncbi:hypothetical protein BJ165DRAFT_1520548 [Panaeolus papilionaceus]|nr:hypothetical protein BJ165DRAFT_1520548 [Panaeolus papilionaceus]
MPQASTREGTVGLTHPELRRLVDDIDALLGQEEQGAIGVGLQGIRDGLQCRLESTKHPFSSITESSLTEMNISTIGDLKWKGTNIPPEPPMELDVSPGSDAFWTEAWLTQHLRRLERRIVFTKEAASRMWIDAFLLYVSDEIYATNGMTMVLSP